MVNEIYELDGRIETLINEKFDPETGEIVDDNPERLAELIQETQMEKAYYLEQVALYAKNRRAMSEALGAEIKRLQTRKRVEDRKFQWAKSFLESAGMKINTARAQVSFRIFKSGRTVIDSVELIPERFWKKPKTEDDVYKTEIAKAIKAGETVSGAHLEDRVDTIIK